MASYIYHCKTCDAQSVVTRPIPNCDDPLACSFCNDPLHPKDRIITPKVFYGAKVDEPFYAPALGKWVSGQRELRREAKSRGWEEVGTEDPNKLLDRSERDREAKMKARYDSLTEPITVRSA